VFLLISIIGSGRVGASIGFLCVANALDDVLLVNRTKDKALGESLDIANAIPFTSKYSIKGTDDYSELSGSNIIVIAASRDNYTKDRTENLKSQVDMIKEIAKKIKRYSPSSIILVISNPADVLTYFFQKESGFSRFKIMGIASSLDSSRFRYLISEKLSVPQSSISSALVIGEHGDTMVPIFSNVSVNGVDLNSLIDVAMRESMINDVRGYWMQIRNYKSRSQFGIAKNTYDVIHAIINRKEIDVPASIVLEGEYGENNVSLGVPVTINQYGVSEIQKIDLNEYEKHMLKESSKKVRADINSV